MKEKIKMVRSNSKHGFKKKKKTWFQVASGPQDVNHTFQANPLNKCVSYANTYSKAACCISNYLADQYCKTLAYPNSGTSR